MKKKVASILAVTSIISLSLIGCGNTNGNETSETIKIGILQASEHIALDLSRDGFIEALADNGFVNGENIVLDIQNAQDDSSNLKTMSQKFVNDKSDLVLAIATPAAQTMAGETKDIPILITAVTDPADAKVVESNEKPNTNVTGTSDLTPIAEQIDLMMELLPETKNLAIMYNSSEANSIIQANIADEYARSIGLNVEHKTITSTNDITQVTESIVGKFDAIYIPTDNVIASAMSNVAVVSVPNKLPVIVGEQGMCEQGGLASVGINYYTLGYKTGEMAVKILNGESVPQDMAIEYAPDPDIILNAAYFNELGLEIPADLAEKAIIVNE